MQTPFERRVLAGIAAVALAAVGQPATAQTTEDVGVEILQLLIDEGLVSAEKAQGLLDRARQAAQLRVQRDAPATATTVDVPYVPEIVRLQLREEIKADLIAEAKDQRWIAPGVLPDWSERISFSGDFRVRQQSEFFGEDNFPFFPDANAINQAGGVNTAEGFPILNSTVDRNRQRYRARLGVDAKLTDRVAVGLRLASGDDAGAVSTNETLGDYLQKDSIWIDRAYVQIQPIANTTVWGGRMPNPFFSTDLVWDADINPEGVAGSGTVRPLDAPLDVFGSVAAFSLQERSISSRDSWMYGVQAGLTYEALPGVTLKAAAAYYDFKNVTSEPNPPDGSRLNDFTAPPVLAKGNSTFNIRTDGLTTLAGRASDFDLLNVTGEVVYRRLEPVLFGLTADYVKNLAFDADGIAFLRQEPGVPPGDTGWSVSASAGYANIARRGEWQLSAGYKYLETDAVLDIFTDADFGLGGTDVEGYVLRAALGIYDRTALELQWLSSNAIDGPPFAIDVLQLNLNAAF